MKRSIFLLILLIFSGNMILISSASTAVVGTGLLKVTHVSATSVMIERVVPSVHAPFSLVIEITEEGSGVVSTYTTSDDYYLFTNLLENTTYNVTVQGYYNNGITDVLQTTFRTDCINSGTAKFIDGTASGCHFPVNNNYNYTLTQSLYLAEELSGLTTIDGITLNYPYYIPMTHKTNVSIYIGHTDASSFESMNWVPASSLQLIYTGPLNCNQGLNYFKLDSIFQYNGTQNLVICFDDNSNSYDHRDHVFGIEQTSSYLTIATHANFANPSIANPSPQLSTTYAYNGRPHIVFSGSCSPVGLACSTPNFMVVNGTSNSVDLAWIPNNAETGFELEYKEINETTWTNLGIFPTTSHTINNLNENTAYSFRIRAVCSGLSTTESAWVTEYFTTPCHPITFPFSENFDNYALDGFPPCWEKRSGTYEYSYAVLYPHISTSYYKSYPNSLEFYDENAGYGGRYVHGILPAIPATEQFVNLVLSFDMFRTYISSSIDIGIIDDPDHPSHFELIETISSGEVGFWEDHTVHFLNYTGSGKYLTFRMKGVGTFYLDNVVLKQIPSCHPPFDIEISDITQYSALLNWNLLPVSTPQLVHIDLRENATGLMRSFTTMNSYFLLSDLQENTAYTAFIYGDCSAAGNSDTIPFSFTTKRCHSGGEVEFLHGRHTSSPLPITISNHYSATQSMYRANEMNGATTIHSITLDYDSYDPITQKNNVDIYMGHTSQSNFNQGVWISASQMQLVYSGHLNCVQGLNVFNFDTLFQYNGTDNLVICFDDNSGSSDGYDHRFRSHENTGANMSLYFFSNTINPDVNAISSGLSPTYSRPNIVFHTACDSVACGFVNLSIVESGDTCVTLAWPSMPPNMDFELEYRSQYHTDWIALTPSFSTHHTFSGLSGNTHYYFRMRTICADTLISDWNQVSYRTGCPDFMTIPYFESFDNEDRVGYNPDLTCWTRHATNSLYFGISSNYYGTAPGALGLRNPVVAAAPPIDTNIVNINSLIIDFDLYADNNDCLLEFGFMQDPNDISTFELVDTVRLARRQEWEHVFIRVANYQGNGIYPAFRLQATSHINAFDMDNLRIDYDLSCYPVRDLEVSQVNYGSALISWSYNYGQNLDGYTVQYRIVETAEWMEFETGELWTILTGLDENADYEVRVRAVCSNSEYDYAHDYFSTVCLSGRIAADCDTVTCVGVNIIPTNVTDSSAQINLMILDHPLDWYFAYQRVGDNAWTEFHHTWDDLFHLTDLTLGSTYNLKSYAHCSNGDSSEVSIASFQTPCGKIKYLPYTESFESYVSPNDQAPYCWSKFSTYSNPSNMPFVDIYSGYSSNSSLYFGVSSDTWTLIALPELDSAIDMNSTELSFYVYTTLPNQYVEIGVMENPTDTTTYVPIETIQLTTLFAWRYLSVPLHYYGNGRYVTIRHKNSSFGFLRIDDIRLDYSPSCSRPLNIEISDVGFDHVEVQWTGLANVLRYEICVDTAGFDPYLATPSSTNTIMMTVGGLQENTNYELYIRSICGNMDTSEWSYSIPFKTPCLPLTIQDIPYLETFDVWGDGRGSFPDCWALGNDTRGTGHDAIYISTNDATSPPGSLYLSNNSNSLVSILPPVDGVTVEVADLALRFNARFSYYGSNPAMEIGVMDDPDDPTTHTIVGEITPSANDVFDEYEVYLSEYTGIGKYITLRSTVRNIVNIDDVMLLEMPTCPIPINLETTDVTHESATIHWRQVGTAQHWIIEYDTVDFEPGNGSFLQLMNASPFTLTGLEELTTYYYYIRAYCGTTDTSRYSKKRSFSTKCGFPIPLPFNENFDSYTTTASISQEGILPPCWYSTSDNSRYPAPHITVQGANTYPSSGTKCLTIIAGGSGQNAYAVFPAFDVPLDDYKISFKYRMSRSASGTFYIGVLTGNQQEVNTFVPLDIIPQRLSLTDYNLDFSRLRNIPVNATHLVLYSHCEAVNFDMTISVDDILIDYAPIVCDPPGNLLIQNIEPTSVMLSWEASIDAISHSVGYKLQTDSAYITIPVSGTTYTLQNLMRDTVYDIRIQSVCPEAIDSIYLIGDFRTLNTYYITATAGMNGFIEPMGTIPVIENESQTFLFTPDNEYEVFSLFINNVLQDVPSGNSYTFENVTENGTIHVDFALHAVDIYDIKEAVNIFPNPVHDILKVSSPLLFESYEVINILGETMLEGQIKDYYIEINMRSLKAGVYFLRLKNENKVEIKQFVKSS